MPLDRNAELQRFAEADRHICNAERAIGHQMMDIERLREGSHNTTLAEEILVTFQRTLKEMEEHRKIIIRTIEEIDAGFI